LSTRARNVMDQPQHDIAAKTELPKPAALQDARRQDVSAAPGELIFDVQDVSVYYGAFKAVTGVTMPIYENEITAFIGSSGSGTPAESCVLPQAGHVGHAARGDTAL